MIPESIAQRIRRLEASAADRKASAISVATILRAGRSGHRDDSDLLTRDQLEADAVGRGLAADLARARLRVGLYRMG